jgi:hypothetical protein
VRPTALLLVAACSPHGGVLVDHARWVQAPADDPFPADRPADDACPDGSFYEESGALEVDAARCRYLVIAQPSLARVAKGDRLDFYAYHQTLIPPSDEEGVQAHLALALDGDVLWEVHVPLPAAPTPYPVTLTADRGYAEGSTVVLHVHNHGANKYTFLDLEATPPDGGDR